MTPRRPGHDRSQRLPSGTDSPGPIDLQLLRRALLGDAAKNQVAMSPELSACDQVAMRPGLPAGVKFDPSELELLEHLEQKVGLGDSRPHVLIDEFIPTIDNDEGIFYLLALPFMVLGKSFMLSLGTCKQLSSVLFSRMYMDDGLADMYEL
ncbi:unnamed protein product [Miscanthus lutarioriparius]|uniref:NAC domain-containing protein n=1 Tax=Miscanthus lutarioriparius TaxID=422564 RepID=A0A811QAB3_9POAL|nr:unnamed protein product [Miscanthus lutarioriparius]